MNLTAEEQGMAAGLEAARQQLAQGQQQQDDALAQQNADTRSRRFASPSFDSIGKFMSQGAPANDTAGDLAAAGIGGAAAVVNNSPLTGAGGDAAAAGYGGNAASSVLPGVLPGATVTPPQPWAGGIMTKALNRLY